MKQNRLIMFAVTMLLGLSNALANDNTFVVNGIEIPQGGSATLEIGLNNPDYENNCYGFQFLLSLPEGVTASNVVASSRIPNDYTTQMSSKDGGYQVLSYNSSESVISGTTGTIVTITLSAGAGLVNGDSGTGKIKTCKITTGGGSSETINEELSFAINIGEPVDPRTVLDENYTTVPSAASNVDVRVRRIFKANVWSTICLPFAMSADQVLAAFGSGVKLGDFTGYSVEDAAGEMGITVNFDEVTAIEANHPYIIKVDNPMTEFTVDGVTIAPEDEPKVSFGYTTGSKNKVYHPSDFIGTYVAGFNFYDAATSYPLFLNGNKFYYATEQTMPMKAYRAYFDFDDYLPEAEQPESARIMMSFDDETTKIDARTMEPIETGKVYNLAGQYLGELESSDHLPKGVYIVNGKKKIIK